MSLKRQTAPKGGASARPSAELLREVAGEKPKRIYTEVPAEEHAEFMALVARAGLKMAPVVGALVAAYMAEEGLRERINREAR